MKKCMLFLLIPATVCLLVATGCKKSTTNATPSVSNASHDVYVLGKDPDGYCYWKNGTRIAMPATTKNLGSAVTSIYVSDTDVYVCGTMGKITTNVPIYWKNGTGIILNSNGSQGVANSIFVAGSDVYTAGIIVGDRPACWKNADAYPLSMSPQAYNGAAGTVYVSGNDVYVAGNQLKDDLLTRVATYWKNGSPVTLTTTGSASAKGIYVTGGNVYCAGSDDAGIQSWMNGTESPLMPAGSSIGSGRIIYVNGSDVYVAGQSDGTAKYWKNGSVVGLTTQEQNNGIATCISGVGADVFIGGASDGNNGIWGYWKNGVFTQIPGCTYVYDIAVK